MKHLVKKANRYYIHWNIPKDVRHHFTGLAVYSRSLKTGSLGQALVRRDHLLAELEGVVRQARAVSEDQQFLELVTEIRRASTTSQVSYCEPAPVVPVVANEPTQGITLQSAVTSYTHEEGGTLDPSNFSRLNLAPKSFLTYLNLKDVPLEAIDKRDVITWVIENAKIKAPRTAKAYANCLLKVWDWAYRSKEVSGDNPFKGLDLRLASSSSKRTAFTVKQVASLVETAGPAMKALMKFALVTGCRLGELATLNTQDFHELEGVHYFIIKEGKTANATRSIPLPVALWDEFKGVVASGIWERTETRTRPSSAQYWSVMFQKHKDTVLGKETSAVFHSFRKMAATGYQQANVFEGLAASILGHSKTGLTLSYGLYATGFELHHKLEAVEKMLSGEYMQSFLKLFPQ